MNQIDKEKWLQEKDHLIYQMNMLTEKYGNNEINKKEHKI